MKVIKPWERTANKIASISEQPKKYIKGAFIGGISIFILLSSVLAPLIISLKLASLIDF